MASEPQMGPLSTQGGMSCQCQSHAAYALKKKQQHTNTSTIADTFVCDVAYKPHKCMFQVCFVESQK